jgi:hypothetical protein
VNSENVVKNLRALWRTDRIIADIRMRHMLVGFGLRALAALIAAFGLLMLELSAYFALVQVWSTISAADCSRPVRGCRKTACGTRARTRERNSRLGDRSAAK